jgi:hypothetical protein
MSGTSNDFPKRMDRRTASKYLRQVHGVRLSHSSLAKKALTGDGPAFFKDGPFVVYDRDEHLDPFAVQRLGKARTSTSDVS